MNPRTIRFLVLVWSSFLPATLATIVFFAAFDPTELARHATFPMDLSPLAGYSLGFAGFWALTSMAVWMATFLLRQDV